MCRNCKYINKDSFYNDIVYEGTTSERVEVVGYCERYDQEVWVDTDECTNYEESEEEKMTNEEAIKRLSKIRAIYLGMDNKSDVKALDMAIKALQENDFLTFLMNNINKNDLEVYLSMYNSQNEKGSEEE